MFKLTYYKQYAIKYLAMKIVGQIITLDYHALNFYKSKLRHNGTKIQ